jgi:hypothetical protein
MAAASAAAPAKAEKPLPNYELYAPKDSKAEMDAYARECSRKFLQLSTQSNDHFLLICRTFVEEAMLGADKEQWKLVEEKLSAEIKAKEAVAVPVELSKKAKQRLAYGGSKDADDEDYDEDGCQGTSMEPVDPSQQKTAEKGKKGGGAAFVELTEAELLQKAAEEEAERKKELAAQREAEEKERKKREDNEKRQAELEAKKRQVEVPTGAVLMKRDEFDEFGGFGGGGKKGKKK